MTFQKGNTAGFKHGYASPKAKSPEYVCWSGIKRRCFNPDFKHYPYYGGRGITMAPEWVNDFAAFIAHVGPRPSPQHTIDRFPDNDGNYEPGNVRWATRKEQVDNRRSTRFITVNGVKLTIDKACVALGMSRKLITSRLEKGWSAERIAATPKLTRYESGVLAAQSRNLARKQ